MVDVDDLGGPKEMTDERFDELYRVYYERLRVQCARVLHDEAAAEDAAQETLLRAWSRRDHLRDDEVGAWLTVVARNLCFSMNRARSRDVPVEVLAESPDPDANPAIDSERAEVAQAVRKAIAELPSRHRDALYLKEFEGLDHAQLGTRLDLSPLALRQLLFRARAGLRSRLAAGRMDLSALLLQVRTRVRDRVWRWQSTFPHDLGSWGLLLNTLLAASVALFGTLPSPQDSPGPGTIGRFAHTALDSRRMTEADGPGHSPDGGGSGYAHASGANEILVGPSKTSISRKGLENNTVVDVPKDPHPEPLLEITWYLERRDNDGQPQGPIDALALWACREGLVCG